MKNTTIASIVFALTLFVVAGAGSSAAGAGKKDQTQSLRNRRR